MSEQIKVAFASGSAELNVRLVLRLKALYPELPLYVVSEFPCEGGRWVPYHPTRSLRENWARCRAAFRGKRIRLAGVLLAPRAPYRRMRLMALLLAPRAFLAFNENLDNFMLRPWCAGAIVRHAAWRTRSFLRYQLNPGGQVYTFFWRLVRPRQWRRPLLYLAARLAGRLTAALKRLRRPARLEPAGPPPEAGISVVIPSRNGKELLAGLLPGVMRELAGTPSEVIVVDNGSDDGTAEFLQADHPEVLVESSPGALSFARAANRGIRRARFSRVCLLNNDMRIEAGFFAALEAAFARVPDLFAATAQIFFPPGERRQETGKAVMSPRSGRHVDEFPVRCELPIAGEDSSYVLYGSGGCTLYCADKLQRLGGLREIYQPAYVEDLDLGYRAWLRGWPTVFCAGARVLHQHRATTSRYYTAAELEAALEINYLRFLAQSVASPPVFRRLWREAIRRLNRAAAYQNATALAALAQAWRAPGWTAPPAGDVCSDELVLALGSGSVTVFPGRPPAARPVVLVASPYLPFPLSHGGAVRIYNLMLRAAAHFDQVLVCFADELATPPPELTTICAAIVLVRRARTHSRPRTRRPDTVEEFCSGAFRAALRLTIRQWRPAIAQLEFTQMAQYAPDCAPAKTILVEHDITFDLCRQLLEGNEDWDLRQEYPRWLAFETAAWRAVDCVVTMSEQDRRVVRGARVECLANGVDLDRFRPSGREPEPGRLLFIGSFAHLPNLLAVEFFLREVWPALAHVGPKLHIIAGARHLTYVTQHSDRVRVDLRQAGLEVEDFVSDVRPAYERATVVIAPLPASAGTNIKILEAMAMGKAIVSTPAGINGLDLQPGRDLQVAETAQQFAGAIERLLVNDDERRALELQARATAEQRYGWDAIARAQRALYANLL